MASYHVFIFSNNKPAPKEKKRKLDGVGKKTVKRNMKTWWGRKEDGKKKNENLMGLERKEWKLDWVGKKKNENLMGSERRRK